MITAKTIILSFCLLAAGAGNLWAQQGTDASGGEATGSGGSVSYTIGQIDYVTAAGSEGKITQGVQQPYEIFIVTGVGEMGINLAPSVYPNPATAFVILSIECTKEDNLNYQIYDPVGNLLIHKKLACSETFISIADLPNAVYFMRVLNKDKEVKTFKIIKTI